MQSESWLHKSLNDFLDQLASDSPTPGGGSVAALVGALAAALGQMSCALTCGRPKFAAVEPQVRELSERFARAGGMLRDLVDEDAVAYGLLSDTLKLDKSDPQREPRIAQAACLAAMVPLETATLCSALQADLAQLHTVANPLLRSDVEAALHLAGAAVHAGTANARANLPLMSAEDARQVAGQLQTLLPRTTG